MDKRVKTIFDASEWIERNARFLFKHTESSVALMTNAQVGTVLMQLRHDLTDALNAVRELEKDLDE